MVARRVWLSIALHVVLVLAIFVVALMVGIRRLGLDAAVARWATPWLLIVTVAVTWPYAATSARTVDGLLFGGLLGALAGLGIAVGLIQWGMEWHWEVVLFMVVYGVLPATLIGGLAGIALAPLDRWLWQRFG